MQIAIELDYNSDTEERYTVKLHHHSILTTVTSTGSVVHQWISDIYRIHRCHLHHLIVGLDVEWLPNIYSSHRNRVAILQLCVGHRCLIFLLIHSDSIPESLVKFLTEPDYTFVGVNIEEDVKKLGDDYQLYVTRTSDLRPLAAEELGVRELSRAGLKRLAAHVLGVEVNMPKRITMSKWDADFLVLDQVLYACMDAFLSFEIGRKLINGNIGRFPIKWAVLFFLSLSLESWLWNCICRNGAQSLF